MNFANGFSATASADLDASVDIDGELTHPADRLARFGLEVAYRGQTDGSPSYIVRGNTYPLNDCLEAAGGHWDQDQEAWLFTGEKVLQKLIAQIEAADIVASGPGLNEASSAFEGFLPADPLLARFLDFGPHVISDEELLQLLLSSGEQPSECPEISRSLLETFGSLSAIFAAEKARLSGLAYMSSKMVARMKAVQLAIERVLHEPIKENPIIGSWTSLTDYLKVTLATRPPSI